MGEIGDYMPLGGCKYVPFLIIGLVFSWVSCFYIYNLWLCFDIKRTSDA